MIKRITIACLLSIFLFSFGFGQERGQRGERGERFKAQKIAHISTQLNLSTEQAEKFWPIYNEHENQKKGKDRNKRNRTQNLKTASDAEVSQFIDDRMKEEEDKLALKKKFIADLRQVISDRQIVALFEAERSFRKEILGRMSKSKGMKGKRKQKEKNK